MHNNNKDRHTATDGSKSLLMVVTYTVRIMFFFIPVLQQCNVYFVIVICNSTALIEGI